MYIINLVNYFSDIIISVITINIQGNSFIIIKESTCIQIV